MGNGFSKVNLNIEKSINTRRISDFLLSVDAEIGKQILSINSDDIVNLIKEDYCNKLIKIVDHLLISNFNSKEIFYIYTRVHTSDYIPETDVFMDTPVDNDKNRHYSKNIAKFIVKIGHLYAVILSTLNPTFTYTDYAGKIQVGNLEDKDNATNITLKETSICSKRISSLLFNINLLGTEPCNDKSQNDTISIPELKPLYNDIYDLETKSYRELTVEAQKKYNDDLSTFYKSFTGKSEVPDNIKTFCDVKLDDQTHIEPVVLSIPKFENMITLMHHKNILGSQLFANFAEHLANILKYAESQKHDILSIVSRLFNSKDDVETIHAKLTEDKLNSLVTQCRKIVVNIHITCEKDYVVSINTLEAIIELVKLQTQVRRIKNLEQDIMKLA
jgi:hypothetical protein